ncbi:MAG TPA: PDZ domain-containing protein [Bacteroidetes bacterium]|nr:PDZ domain-containing protein [Bacteroidota bacterium]
MRPLILILLFNLITSSAVAQHVFGITENFKKIHIPFEYENNMIIVDVMFNRVVPLKFIFDTGAENTILARREITDMLNVRYRREYKLLGSDMKTELTAYLVRGIHFKVENLVMPSHSMLVLADDYFRFEEMTGMEIHGILGADVFRNLVVRINYEKREITIKKRKNFKPPKGYMSLPIEVKRNKPYIKVPLRISSDSISDVKLLLDSGATLSLLINMDTKPGLHLPPNTLKGNVGAGLGGFIEGYLGRVSSLQLGGYEMKEIITNFQDLSESVDTSLLNGRNGILGNQILSRFDVIIDYPKEVLYLKANKKFNKKFEFDKSGLIIIASGKKLREYTIHEVIPGTPAAEAGLQKGDKVTRINGRPPGWTTLPTINHILRKKAGKKIKMTVKRNGKKIKVKFYLRELI